MSQHKGSCLVVGGGLSGLMAATILQQQGIQVTVVDKGYGIGGRLASRSVAAPSGEKGLFDYGAQYFPRFKSSDSRFQTWLDQRVTHGIMQQWAEGFPTVSLPSSSPQESANVSSPQDDPSARFLRGITSNRHVAKDLAATLDVRNQTRIETLKWYPDSRKWEAISSTSSTNATNGTSFHSDAVILTSPVPQTLQILADSGISLPLEQEQLLEQVSYSRTIAVLAILEQECTIPSPGGLSIEESKEIMWMASNSIKGISPRPSVTIHATPELSGKLWNADKEEMARQILDAAAPWLGSPVLAYHVHRWGYSQPTALYDKSFAVVKPPLSTPQTFQPEEHLDLSGQLILAGDAFGSPAVKSHIERAWLSGVTAAEYLCDL